MEFFRTPQLKYISNRKYFFGLSILITILGIVSFGTRGLNMSIDFSGGNLIQGVFKNGPVPLSQVRDVLDKAELGGAQLQSVPERNAVILRYKSTGESKQEFADKVTAVLDKSFGDKAFEVERVEFVGPIVGKKLLWQALMAIVCSLGGIALYVAFRFKKLIWGAAGVFALLHDVFAALTFMSLLGRELSIPVVAALLTIAGYSINDTIVIFDRIRENLRNRARAKEPLDVLIDRSCNETLSRTIITSMTVIIVLLALILWGGEVLRDFSLCMMFGVLVGTYSSIFIASPIVYIWQQKRNKPLF